MLSAHNLKLSHGDRVVLDDVSLSLMAKDRVALVGQNGAGKSSLLDILAHGNPDSGIIEIARNCRVGILTQIPELNNDATVLETVRGGMSQHFTAISRHQALCQELSKADDARVKDQLIKEIDELSSTIERLGGFDVDFFVERVLSRLGILARDQKVGTLSGGERRRVDMARILLSAPDIYLLDEPTNHLDINAIQFLVETLSKANAAVLFVSHDSAFVDDLATRIVELANGKIYSHEPPYANFLESKLVRELIDERTLHRRERLVATELAWLRAGTKARTTKQNARIDRAHALIDQVANDQEVLRKHDLQLQTAASARLGGTIMELDHVGAQVGKRVLFKDLTLKVTKRQRYGILGPNGAGKTTLLSILAKKIAPSFGAITHGKNTVILEFDQHRELLDQEATLKETLADYGDYVMISDQKIHIASYLERYLFSGGDANRRVKTLSGGEQNRLLLAKLFRHKANCLLLDEPTNDLDVTSLAVLEEVLLDFDGVVFTVSHDRRFLDRICTAIIAFEPNESLPIENSVTVYPGNYSTYVTLRARQSPKETPLESIKKESPKPARLKEKKRRTYKEEQEFSGMEATIEKLEAEHKALHDEIQNGELFRNNPQAMQQKLERLTKVEAEIERLYARWQELSDMNG